MMMRAFAPSAATDSDATTTSGFGSGLGSGNQSKNRHSYLKLILCCALPNSCPHTKFHPNWTKNIEVKMISYRLASVGWSGRSKNSCILFRHNKNLISVVYNIKIRLTSQSVCAGSWL